MIKYLIAMGAMLISVMAFSGASDDNEINIDQSGDTLTLYIDEIGYGNKVGGDDFDFIFCKFLNWFRFDFRHRSGW